MLSAGLLFSLPLLQLALAIPAPIPARTDTAFLQETAVSEANDFPTRHTSETYISDAIHPLITAGPHQDKGFKDLRRRDDDDLTTITKVTTTTKNTPSEVSATCLPRSTVATVTGPEPPAIFGKKRDLTAGKVSNKEKRFIVGPGPCELFETYWQPEVDGDTLPCDVRFTVSAGSTEYFCGYTSYVTTTRTSTALESTSTASEETITSTLTEGTSTTVETVVVEPTTTTLDAASTSVETLVVDTTTLDTASTTVETLVVEPTTTTLDAASTSVETLVVDTTTLDIASTTVETLVVEHTTTTLGAAGTTTTTTSALATRATD